MKSVFAATQAAQKVRSWLGGGGHSFAATQAAQKA